MNQREYMKKWRLEHAEEMRGYRQKWRAENRDRIREYNRSWRRQNKAKIAKAQAKYWKRIADEDAAIENQI